MATIGGEGADGAVLFVHGIGSRGPGEALALWAGALGAYLGVAPVPGAVPVAQGRRRTRGDGGPPASVVWRLGDGDGGASRWLLTESWWAGSFPSPSMRAFVLGSFLVFPRLAVFHVRASYTGLWAEIREEARGRPPGHPRGPAPARPARARLRSAVGLPLCASTLLRVGAVGVVLLAVCVCAALHAAGRRGPMVALLRSLGDSLAAVADDRLARGAQRGMVDRIKADVERCAAAGDGPVVVVAHSQGAMLTRQALAERGPDARVSLLTVGAGVGPLAALDGADRAGGSAAAWAVLAMLAGYSVVCLRGAAEVVRAAGGAGSGLGRPLLVVLVLFVVALAAVLTLRGASGVPGVFDRLRGLALDETAGWVELSARHDPVSCGPLLDESAARTEVVGNSRNLFLQHVQYHRNPYVLWHIASRMPGALGGEEEALARGDGAKRHSESYERALRVQGAVLLFACTVVLMAVLAPG